MTERGDFMNCSFLQNDRPTLTMMIQARTPDRVLELIEKGIKGSTDAFGLQIEVLEHKYRTNEIFNKIFTAAQNKPVYVTNYRSGLNENMSDDERVKELLTAAESGAALIDIMGDLYCKTEGELTYNDAAIHKQTTLIDKIHSMGAEVLMSSHTYKFMPKEQVIAYVTEQHRRGADIAKVVTGAESRTELMQNICISAELSKESYSPALFLCCGEYCRTHRIIGPMISGGMYLCVAEHDELATPAQPLLEDAKKAIELLK